MRLGRPLLESIIDNRFTRRFRHKVDRLLVRSPAGLRIFERFASHSSMRVRQALHSQSAKSLYGAPKHAFGRALFHVSFLGNEIKVPLRQETAGFDWDYALSLPAHDVEVKRVYEIYLKGEAPTRFIDIGANFGGHTALFLASGAEVHSFEPLPQCGAHFEVLSKANGWHHANWHRTALSDEGKVSEIRYPAGEEWLATIVEGAHTGASANTIEREVGLSAIDDFDLDLAGALVKIDVEGHELSVLQGCRKTDVSRVFGILFESNSERHRSEIASWAADHGFQIVALSLDAPQVLSRADFIASAQTNFFMGSVARCEHLMQVWAG